MAYCVQSLKGISLDCASSMGGIKAVYLANFDDVKKVALDTSGEKITGFTMTEGVKFKAYQFRKNTGSMTSTLTADESTGLNYVTTEVSLVFTKMETVKRIEMTALAQAQLAVIVLDSNGVYWYTTMDDYASATTGTGETGTSKGDRNAYGLTLTSENNTYPFEVDASAIETIIEA
jgi:hypothetical protein